MSSVFPENSRGQTFGKRKKKKKLGGESEKKKKYSVRSAVGVGRIHRLMKAKLILSTLQIPPTSGVRACLVAFCPWPPTRGRWRETY